MDQASPFKRGLDTILTLRLHIAVLMFFMIYARFPDRPSTESLLISLCFAALFAAIYISNKITDMKEDTGHAASLPITAKEVPLYRRLTFICAFAPALYLTATQQWGQLALFGLLGLIGYAYNRGLGSIRLKELYIGKNISIAILWTLGICAPPMIAAAQIPPAIYVVIAFAITFMTGLMLQWIWDIRDTEADRAAGIRTLPNTLGIHATKLAITLLVSANLFILYFIRHYDPGFALLLLVTLAFALFSGGTRSAYFYQAPLLCWLLYFILKI